MLEQVAGFQALLQQSLILGSLKQKILENMEVTSDWEKQLLIETYLEPLTRTSPAEDSELSEDDCSVDGLLLHQETCSMSAYENNTRRTARKKLLIACGVSLVFMTGEVIGGYWAHSLAIMTDAAHLLTDFCSIVISIVSLVISSRPQTQTMTFGWHRAEILGMFLSIVSIWVVTAVLVMSAVQRITDGDYDIDSQIMLITSGCAVLVNILMILILHQSGTSHGHSHGIPSVQGDKHSLDRHRGNASVKAAFIHVLGDLLQSAGVLLAATIIHIWPEYKVADPVCTFLFSVLVIGTTLPITKDVFRILMEGAPQDVTSGAVREQLLSFGKVKAVNSLHTWSLNMNHSLLAAHITIEEDADSQIILRKATKLLRSKFGFSSITIQVEQRRTSAAP
ncbi:zinc transporter 2-like isoform X2 [Cyprinodon tularosa]|uniref:zinc transporter 2-like isoform X2 n=1 Tax=Cyprinodon tularosa TaxID=77115 RepID=UPI0018E2074B|nr:zinc transporter 2-like isoform X2 [Cyprinodon tularosa]